MTAHVLLFSWNEEWNIFCIMHERYDMSQIIPQTNGHIINGAVSCACMLYIGSIRRKRATWAYGKWRGQGIKALVRRGWIDHRSFPHVSLVPLGANILRLHSGLPVCQKYNRDWAEIITCASRFLTVAPVIMTITPQWMDYGSFCSVCSRVLLLARENLLYLKGQSIRKLARFL